MNQQDDKSVTQDRTHREPVKGWRKWVRVTIVSVVVPALFFLLFEGALRLFGYGFDPGFLVENGDFYESNSQFGWRFFPKDISRAPIPFHVAKDKPEGTVRILVVGGSAAQGYPEPAFSFSRYLGVMLQEQFPGKRFEVVNAAMTAANSHMMLPATRDCMKLNPDFVVVYVGNNEVVGPYGPGTVFAGATSNLSGIRRGLWIQGTRVGQLMSGVRGPGGKTGSGEWEGMGMFLENLVPADDPRLESTYSHFGKNVTDICKAAQEGGATPIVCTVPVNLRHCAPFASEGIAESGTADFEKARQITYELLIAKEREGDYAGALEGYTVMLEAEDQDADLHFRTGRCYAGLGDAEKASKHFRRARELDALRFRADASINRAVRDLVGSSGGRVKLVDAEKHFDAIAELPGCPGEALFFDHVHPSYLGNYELARAVFTAVSEELGDSGSDPVSFERCNERLALTHRERLRNASALWRLTRRAPFTNQLDYLQMRARMLERCEDLWAQEAPLSEMLPMYASAVEGSPDDAILNLWAGMVHGEMGETARAREYLASAKRLCPNEPQVYFAEAMLALDERDDAMVDESLGTYLELQNHALSDYIKVVNLLGGRGRQEKAEEYAREALERRPGQAPALTAMAKVVKSRQARNQVDYRANLDEAKALLDEAIAAQPNYPNAWVQQGEVQLAMGQVYRASESFRRAIELDPELTGAYTGMGVVYFRLDKRPQAKACFGRAVELSPEDLQATVQYAEMLCMDGEVDAASKLLTRALQMRPGMGAVAGKLAWIKATTSDPDIRDASDAVRLAEMGASQSGGRPSSLMALGAAYAANGEFERARAVVNQAIRNAERAGQTGVVGRLRDQLMLYSSEEALYLDKYDRLEGW